MEMRNGMAAAIDKIAAAVPTDNDTYRGDDGLLYCTRCHTARQTRIEQFGKTVNCLCKCMVEERDQREAEQKQREHAAEVMRNRVAGFRERELMQYTFSTDDGSTPIIANAMKEYVNNFSTFKPSGQGLFLYGDVGTGKTFYAACIVNALTEKGCPCLMTNFAILTNQISGTQDGKQDFVDSLSAFDLVAIDDLGAERDTEYMNENVTTIIDSLYRAKVPMIITSNYTPTQLTTTADMRRKRVYDRMLERCHPVKINGASRRKEMGKNHFAEMNRLLGLQ